MAPLVYLAGPITGLSFGDCSDWRQYVTQRLNERGILAASPMRHKDFLRREDVINGAYPEHVLSSERGITHRDRNDVRRCDLLFVNLLGAKRVSIGTVMEIAWADAFRKPIVLAMEDSGNPNDYCMIQMVIGWRVPTLEEAITVAESVISPANLAITPAGAFGLGPECIFGSSRGAQLMDEDS